MLRARSTPTIESLRAQREEFLGIAAARGARNVRVIGSVARGEARADSDIDFLVEMDAALSVLDLSELILDLEEALGREVDVLESRPSSRGVERIEREAIPL